METNVLLSDAMVIGAVFLFSIVLIGLVWIITLLANKVGVSVPAETHEKAQEAYKDGQQHLMAYAEKAATTVHPLDDVMALFAKALYAKMGEVAEDVTGIDLDGSDEPLTPDDTQPVTITESDLNKDRLQ